MRMLLYLKNLLFFTAILVITFVTISKSESKESKEDIMNCERIEVYYISPTVMTYVPITKEDIEKRALSKIIIGNKLRIEEINGILNSIAEKKGSSEGIVDSLTFKIEIKLADEKTEIWIVDKSRNFELNNEEQGNISYESFEKLVHIFDSCVKVIDLKYLESIKGEGKIRE